MEDRFQVRLRAEAAEAETLQLRADVAAAIDELERLVKMQDNDAPNSVPASKWLRIRLAAVLGGTE